jgi:succinoglycan biosynthesis transport protein ExoP
VSDRQEQLTLRGILRVLGRRIGVLTFALLAVPLGAFVVSSLQETKYTATASILFRDPGLDQKLFDTSFSPPASDPSRNAATNARLVSLDLLAARTARRLDRGLTKSDVEDEVEIVPDPSSDVIEVRATDPSAGFAATLANTFAGEYINFRREADRSKVREAQRLLQRRIAALSPVERAAPQGRTLQERARQLEVLEALQTGNAELVERATPPSSASSPKTARNVVMGAVLGLLLGIALAFLIDRLDRRLRDPKEIEEAFSRPLLGAVPQSRTLHRGDPQRELPPWEAEAFRMLRANLTYFQVGREVRSVLVTSAAPGDGKSTVAWHLAAVSADSGTKAVLVEADLRQPTLQARLQGAPAEGLSQYLAGIAELDDVIQGVPTTISSNGMPGGRRLDLILAGPVPPNPVDLIESDRMKNLIRELEQRYELVVLDTPPTSIVSDAIPLVREVSGVIVVSRLGRSTRDASAQLRDQLANLDAPTLGVVVNSARASYNAYGYRYGYGYAEHAREAGS